MSVLTAFAYLVALCVAPGADAAAKLDSNLAALWTTVLQTPSPQNSFGTGGSAFGCWNLGGNTVAPFGPNGIPSCTVKPGTKIFVAANSAECSTFEGDTNPPPPPPWTEAQLRKCAVENDVKVAPSVTVDGKPVPVTEVETPLLNITLPADNILVVPAAGTTGQSVGHGWVTLLHPLTPGTHTIVIVVDDKTITTTIVVKPGP